MWGDGSRWGSIPPPRAEHILPWAKLAHAQLPAPVALTLTPTKYNVHVVLRRLLCIRPNKDRLAAAPWQVQHAEKQGQTRAHSLEEGQLRLNGHVKNGAEGRPQMVHGAS